MGLSSANPAQFLFYQEAKKDHIPLAWPTLRLQSLSIGSWEAM